MELTIIVVAFTSDSRPYRKTSFYEGLVKRRAEDNEYEDNGV
jgi:hypothetical protein